jgi:hypothetical protein
VIFLANGVFILTSSQPEALELVKELIAGFYGSWV